MKTRNPEVDIIKGISIYLVVLGHLLDLIGDSAAWINLCHLPAFFLVSGFLLCGSLSRHSIGELFRSKTKGLLIPYLFWSGISLVANLGLSVIQNGALSKDVFVAELKDIFLHGRSVWFLLQLLLAHYVFLLCKKVVKNERQFWIVSIVAYIFLCLIFPDEWFQLILFKRLYAFFLLGYCFASVSEIGEVFRKRITVGFIPLIACIYIICVWLFEKAGFYEQMIAEINNAYIVILGMAIGAVGVLLIYAFARVLTNHRIGDSIGIIGQYSIDIYVMHMFLVKFIPVQRLLNKFPYTVTYILLMLYAALIVLTIYYLAAYVLRRSKLYCLSVGR